MKNFKFTDVFMIALLILSIARWATPYDYGVFVCCLIYGVLRTVTLLRR